MKIFAISDLHGDYKYLCYAQEKIKDADLVTISGDISRSGKIDSAQKIIEYIEKLNRNILAVHGNWDRAEVLDLLEEKGYSIHASGRVIGEFGFFGVGGSNPTPMKTSSEYSEDEILDFLKQGFQSVKTAKKIILVSHTPPLNTRDRTFLGLRGGSQVIRDFITDHGIYLCLCGHIHEAKGTARLNSCTVVNPGSFKKGKYSIVTFSGEFPVMVDQGKIKRPILHRFTKKNN
ncbi:MAG TPA: metallophosphoesterase family protein [Spirochaetota bacterium]|nr:metallophosphoesterase family protein [Spirochaetota bacterium]HPI91107.1 metallophosphoesterase family protein [Spirochaetota bacterium]HPR48686.1 metallophosphoesterase family protein [Spirochaetota bacterium]